MSAFFDTDIRVGKIIKAENFKEAKKPAYKLWIDFGESVGIKKSSAQITAIYTTEMLIGKHTLTITKRDITYH